MSKREKAVNALRWAKWHEQDARCPLCDQAIPEVDVLDRDKTNIDHINPRAHGGPDRRSNLQLTHIPCNGRKGCGCDAPAGLCFESDKPRMFVSPREVVWRKQDHRCLRCQEVILPSEVRSNEFSKFDGTDLIHRVCATPTT